MPDLRDITCMVLLSQHDKIHIAVFRGKRLAGSRATRVHDRDIGLYGLGLTPDVAALKELAVKVELVFSIPKLAHKCEPFGCVLVAPAWSFSSTPNISNSGRFHPHTRLCKHPSAMWSIVAACFAAVTGCTSGACTVASTPIWFVFAAIPAAHVKLEGSMIEVAGAAVTLMPHR